MKKSSITGWKNVFSFTFIQAVKSKTYMVSFIILMLIAAVSMPVVSLLTASDSPNPDAVSPITKVYTINKSGLSNLDLSALQEETAYSHITFEDATNNDYNSLSKRIEESEPSSIILSILENEGIYSIDFVKASQGPIKDANLTQFGDALTNLFNQIKMSSFEITQMQASIIKAPIDIKVSMLDVNGTPVIKEDTSISDSEYWVLYGVLFIIMMVNVMASTQIATSIVTEKSTRVIENLLISVKPLALIVGKTIAMLAATLIQCLSLIAVTFFSNKVSALLSQDKETDILSKFLPSNIFENINIMNILFCLILIISGMILYAILAGLAGATVSKLEEIQEGLQIFTLVNMVGSMVGVIAANMLMESGTNTFVTFSLLFPLSSPFILPGTILIGKGSPALVAIAVALLFISIFLLFQFVAKVFETLILHNGNTIKLKELVKLSRKGGN